ncbi:MAG: helix-turn-helix domain-containing protein [Clostridia bacterium]|nr:helix-turn-helix domain-containing protein [Clostridia bacterium]
MENRIVLKVKTMDFQEQVKFVRMYLQLSQEEFARQMGISFATVSRWERENRKPQLALLGKFYSFCKRNGIEIDLSDNTNM